MEHYVCIIMLSIFLIISYILSNHDILSPPVVFCVAYLIAALFALFYKYDWLFFMSTETLLVLFIGTLFFIVGYFCGFGKISKNDSISIRYIKIKKWKTMLFVLAEILLLYGTLQYINSISNFPELSDRIAAYYAYRASGMDYMIGNRPFYYTYLNAFCTAGLFVYLYKVANNYIGFNSISVLDFLVIIIGVIITLMSGSRGESIMVFLAILVYFYVIWRKKNGGSLFLSTRNIGKGLVATIIVLIFFVSVTSLQGRDDTKAVEDESIGNKVQFFFDYMSVYCGAELKLLDQFIEENNFTFSDSTYMGMYTFSEMGKNLHKLTQDPNWEAVEYRPLLTVNGVFIGNVYTTYRAFLEDGGLLGVAIFSAVFGGVIGKLYKKSYESNISLKGIEPYLFIYGYLYYTVPLSFFSHWFYMQFNQTSIHLIFDLWLIYLFLLDNNEYNNAKKNNYKENCFDL